MKRGEKGELEIDISAWSVIRAILIVALFALMWFLRDLILVVLAAVLLASAIEPFVRWLFHRGMPRLLALVLIYVVCGVTLLGTTYVLVPAVLSDVSMLARKLPAISELFRADENATLLSGEIDSVQPAALVVAENIQQSISEGVGLLDLVRRGVEEGGAFNAATALFGGILSFVLIVVLSFYLAAQERGIENFLRLISPIQSRGYIVDLWKRSQQKIELWFQGQIVLGMLVGVLVFLTMTLLGVPSALFLAFIAMVFELIPVFGPILAAVPAVALAFTGGLNPPAEAFAIDPGLTAALVVVGLYFFIQQIESQLIYPLVVRKVVGISPVLVILSLVVGAKLAGFLGIILSVPLVAILMEFLSDVARERKIFDDA